MKEICTEDNIELAYKKASHGKSFVHNMLINKEFNPDEVKAKLLKDFQNGTYVTSDYTTFKIYEPKERVIYRLPFAPDRIAHHAIMNVMEEFWVNKMIPTSFSCVKGRGIHGALRYLEKILHNDVTGTKYCLQIDFKKYFPSISHNVLKSIIDKDMKDVEFIKLTHGIISSIDKCDVVDKDRKKNHGVPIGNYLSQFLANLYITDMARYIIAYYNVYILIYMDDILILSDSKESLHTIFNFINYYCTRFLELSIKDNYQIYPVDSRGIDFVGYRFFHTHILLRKSVKKRMMRKVSMYKKGLISKENLHKSLQSYLGWSKYCNSKHLLDKIESITGIKYSNWNGKIKLISNMKDKNILVCNVTVYSKKFRIEAVYKKSSRLCL